ELSGGEYQIVVLARAFVQQTDTLLLDEPTNNLDPSNQQEVMRLVRSEVDRRNIGAAAVMHDMNLALRHCDRFLFIKDGLVDAFGGADIVTSEQIDRIYGMKADVIEHAGCRIVVPL
ncbi:MAG: ABC transporter ATP-binding protein, partial [Eggerthellaceae bacterium]|nr:ABC transporter ATP-binding protein [Eggerthellaceae bacterium]